MLSDALGGRLIVASRRDFSPSSEGENDDDDDRMLYTRIQN